jgi:hypothetical protein
MLYKKLENFIPLSNYIHLFSFVISVMWVFTFLLKYEYRWTYWVGLRARILARIFLHARDTTSQQTKSFSECKARHWADIYGTYFIPFFASLNSISHINIFQPFIPFLSLDNPTPNNIQQIIIIKCIVFFRGVGWDSASEGLYLNLLENNPLKW